MFLMAKEIMKFDKNNSQDNYQYMAKDMNGKYVIGYIVVNQLWYSNEKDWTYYIVRNRYGRSICGGASDVGLEKVIVDLTTVEPYTQIAHIKYNQSIGVDTVLAKDFLGDEDNQDNIVAFVGVKDEIPYKLWQ